MPLHLKNQLDKREKLGNLRQLKISQHLIDFSSNDYLGLARSAYLKEAVIQEWNLHSGLLNGLGSTGSRLLTGNSTYVEELEEKLASFHGYESGLLFSCGYMANLGLLSAVAGNEDVIFFDVQVHTSTHDGIRLSKAKAFPFKHNDLDHLEKRLKNAFSFKNRFICIESIYSTDGSKAPLLEICHLAKKYEALLIVDEAHAVGVYGLDGRGLVSQENLASQVFAQITTFGKALGSSGAIVLGNLTVKKALINFANSYIYTTAPSLLSLISTQCSYKQLPSLKQERLHLDNLIQTFKKLSPFSSSTTHIQSIPIKGNKEAKHLAKKCEEKGIDARPLLSPTVQQGHEVLRICLHSFNTENELRELFTCLDS